MEDIHRALLGNLSLKSSVLSTKGENITNQFMVASNMLSHYKKLQRVKAVVDTKPPKAMLYSTKARDQKLRSLSKTNNNAILAIKAMLAVKNPNLGYLSPTVDSQKIDGRSSVKIKPSGAEPTDLLDLHPFMFTPGKPFQPRTNRTDCTSKLSQLRVYNPPPRARSATRVSRPDSTLVSSRGTQSLLNTARSTNSRKPETAQSAKPPANPSKQRAQRLSLTRTTLDDMTLRSPSQTLDYPKDLDIPLLGISVDKDNQLWQKMLSDKRSMISGLDSTGTLEQQKHVDHQPNLDNGNMPNSSNNFSNVEKADLKSLEEDCKYIEFLQKVTDDILQKGSFTNKVLTKVFEYHIDKNASVLKESRMREMLNQLRSDLGVSYEEINEEETPRTLTGTDFASPEQSARRNTKRSKLKTEDPIRKNFDTLHSANNTNNNNIAAVDYKPSDDQLSSSQATSHSKVSRSSRSSKKKEVIQVRIPELPLSQGESNDNMDNAVRDWLNSNNKSSKRDSLSERGNGIMPKEDVSKSETKTKTDQEDEIDKCDYDDDDTTIASVSSMDDNDQETKDLLDYYNSTMADNSDGPSSNNRAENGFNRTTLSDIPEMSYRSEMVKQRSTEVNTPEKKDEGSEESPNGADRLTISGPDGDSSSRMSSSRSRRRARIAGTNLVQSNSVETSGDQNATLKEDLSMAPTTRVKENGDSSNHSAIFESPKNQRETSDNGLGIKTPKKQLSTNNSNGDENIEVSDDNICSGEQKKDEVIVEANPFHSGERDDDGAKSSRSYEDDYEDDIEEECSISIGDLTDDESVQNGGEKSKDNF